MSFIPAFKPLTKDVPRLNPPNQRVSATDIEGLPNEIASRYKYGPGMKTGIHVMTKKPDGEKIRQKIFSYLEEEYVVKITDNKLDDLRSREMSSGMYGRLEIIIAAANLLTQQLGRLPKNDIPRREREHVRQTNAWRADL